ncbi:MAG TPA: LuxR C-terminal-related transcriptional regulator [Bacteroidia bacterium]|jgi:DNA-binding CsgD family transcriptional regulator|nr:LuxR C-terminal-related transcriptional regulator [Bacteroidia bacterium]
MKLKLGICSLLLFCLYSLAPAQSNIHPPGNEQQLFEKQKQLELLVEKSERKIIKLQTYLYVTIILLLIITLSTLFFWKRNKKKILQLKIEQEVIEKQRTIKKTDSAITSLTKFALQEESGAVKSVKDELIFKLSRTHPSLTDKDHQLCTLLMLNLSSKEMASILNIQEESVEKSRSRLRKKMNLDSNQNFVEYFNSIK